MLLIFAYLSFAVVAGIIAGSRGRSGFGYFALSLVVSPLIGIILAVALPNLRPSIEREAELADTRDCPHCAERIKKGASVCRFCGRDVSPLTLAPARNYSLSTGKPEKVAFFMAMAFIALLAMAAYAFWPWTPQQKPPVVALPAAAPPATIQAIQLPDAPTGALASPKAQPKDAKPKAPAGPLKITPQ